MKLHKYLGKIFYWVILINLSNSDSFTSCSASKTAWIFDTDATGTEDDVADSANIDATFSSP